jgi:hypothetical protein
MLQFQIIFLDKEELALVDRIVKNVAGVTNTEEAVRWALRQFAAEPQGMDAILTVETDKPEKPLQSTPDMSVALPHLIPLPFGQHTCSLIDLAKEVGGLEHMVAVGPTTLQRIVPDRTKWAKLFNERFL